MAKHTVKRKYIAATTEDRDAEQICVIIEKKMKSASELSSDGFDAKSMLLFGNSLFPENFRMKFQSYKIAKQSGDVEKAAHLFRTMYLSFPNEQSFYSELCAVIEDVRTEQKTTNTDLFQGLSKNLQCEILLKFCQISASTIDEVNLKIFIMRNYPHTIRENAMDVIESLSALERESYPQDPLNVYRERLVCDVVPLVFTQMAKKKELEAKMVIKLLHKAVTFYLTYGILSRVDGSPRLIHGSTEEHLRLKDPWLSVRQLLDSVSNYFSWGSLSLPRLQRQPGQTPAQSQQTTEDFVRSLDQVLQSSRSPHRLVLPLVVAHVETTAGYLQRSKPKLYAGGVGRRGAAPVRNSNSQLPADDCGPNLWLCTIEASDDEVQTSEDDEADSRLQAVSHWFTLAMRVWRNAIRLPKEGRKDFDETLRQLRLDSWNWLQIFYMEITTLHSNPFKECQVSDRLNQLISQPAQLFLDGQLSWEKNRPHSIKQLILCLQSLYSNESSKLAGAPKTLDTQSIFPSPSEMPDSTISSHPQLCELSFRWLFNLLVNTLVSALTPVCRRVTAWNHDAYGHTLVLLQWDLSSSSTAERRLELLRSILGMIKQYGSLKYPTFFKYVINHEILEEVVVLQKSLNRPTSMLLAPDMDNEEKCDELLSKYAQLQIEKCHQPIGLTIYEFLVSESEKIAKCFS